MDYVLRVQQKGCGHVRPFTIRLGDGLERKDQMTPTKNSAAESKLHELLLGDEDLLRNLMKQELQRKRPEFPS